jgi:putative transposase
VAQTLLSAGAETPLGAFATPDENLACLNAPSDMPDGHRRLPHQYPPGKWLFVTWHLHGSIPHSKYPLPGAPSADAAFVWMDRYLDTTRTAPTYLSQEAVTSEVVRCLERREKLGHYNLAAYAILSNPVHVLLLPKISPARLLQSLKGATARQANVILGRTGKNFWHAESYDHWVRDERKRPADTVLI